MGNLFIAGIITGIILTEFFLTYVVVYSYRKGYNREILAGMGARMHASAQALWDLFLPPLVIGGIYFEWFTPDEATGVGVVYSFAPAFIAGRVHWGNLRSILLSTLRTTTMVLILIVVAILFGHVITILQVPQRLIMFLAKMNVDHWQFIVLICLIFIFLGDFLEVVSTTIFTLPIIFPIADV